MLSSACASCTSFPRLTERPVWSLVLAGIMPFFPSASFRGLLSSACKTRPPNFSPVAQRGKCKFTTAIQRQGGCPLPCQPDLCDSSETCSPCSAFALSGSVGNAHSLSPPVVHCTCQALYKCICKSLLLISSSPFKTIYVLF